MFPTVQGAKVRGEIEVFTIEKVEGDQITLKGEDGSLWLVMDHDIGTDENGLVIGGEAYAAPV